MRDCKHGQLARSCNLCELEARIAELEAACSNLTTRNLALEAGIAWHRNYSEHYRSILWDGEAAWDLPHNEALWSLLDGTR